MPRPNKDITKAKDFKGAIKRLLKELSGFKKLVIISLVLAALGAILTIVTPNILSDLTDEISKGLVLNKDNFLKLTKEVTSSLNEESISKVIDFSEKNIGKVMMSSNIPKDDLMKFQEIMAKLNDETNNKSFKAISEMPDSILDILVNNDEDAKIFIKSLNSNLVIPEGVASKIFSDIEIDGHVIDAASQGKFLEIVSNIGEDVSATEIYSLVDNMPSSVKVVVEPYMNIDKIKNIAILLICIYLISAIFEYFEAILMTDVSNNFARKLRGNISSKINKLPLKYFDKHAIGDILSRVTNDVDTIAQSMNQSLSTLVSAITLFMGTTIMMFVTNSVMAITAILASLFGFVFMALVLAKSQKYFVAKQNELGALNGHIEEVYSGLNVVKTYNGEKISNEKFDELKVPSIPFYKAKTKHYYGIEEMKQGELNFFKGTVLSKSKEDIFMCSDMPMEDMAKDIDFGKKWMFAIAMCLKKGHHLNIIHNLDRPFNEMMLGLESWIPIYMTGQISPYYLSNLKNNIYNHLNYVSAAAALSGECINGFHNKGMYYLTTNKNEIEYYKEKSDLLLKKAKPLMEIYRESNIKEYHLFLKKDENIECDRTRYISSLPLFTISDELLIKILKRNKLTKEEIDKIIKYKNNEFKYMNSILKKNKVFDYIYVIKEDEFISDTPSLLLNNLFIDKTINYTYKEYIEHLKLTNEYSKNNKNYNILTEKDKTFKNITITILKNNHVIISKNSNPTIHFVIRHPKLVAAIESFNPLVKEL